MNKNLVKDIIEGFEEDFAKIVEDFHEQCAELKFTNFLEFWSEKSLDCLFANRFDPRELLESITEINQVLVKTLVFKQDDHHFVVALYFLLCLNIKQPQRFRRKIRLTCEDAIHIQNTIVYKFNESPWNADLKFVWKQMRLLKAIEYVEERIVYGPSLLRRSNKKNNQSEKSQDLVLLEKRDAVEFLESKIEPALISIESMKNPYQQIKEILKLDDYKPDTTLENNEPSTSIGEFLDQAKSLLIQFKSS